MRQPLRKPSAKAMCTRVLLKDMSTSGAASGCPLVDILEEDPGAQSYRTGLPHYRAGAGPEAAILISSFGR